MLICATTRCVGAGGRLSRRCAPTNDSLWPPSTAKISERRAGLACALLAPSPADRPRQPADRAPRQELLPAAAIDDRAQVIVVRADHHGFPRAASSDPRKDADHVGTVDAARLVLELGARARAATAA